VRGELISLDQLIALRKGEPARVPVVGEVFFLPEERIKVREKAGTSECVFLDAANNACLIYERRLAQCRAQACWDSSASKELAESDAPLTRYRFFEGVDAITQLVEEHDRRCSFQMLQKAFENLEKSEGASLDEALQCIAFDDHFRNFVSDKLRLPKPYLEFFLGRSFVDRLRLFGFYVRQELDGSRVLLPIPEAPVIEVTPKGQGS
jgi:Fe-S-cluster containining protein